MSEAPKQHLATLAVHGGQVPDTATNSRAGTHLPDHLLHVQ